MYSNPKTPRYHVQNTLVGSRYFRPRAPILGYILQDLITGLPRGFTVDEAAALIFKEGADNASATSRGDKLYLIGKYKNYSLRDPSMVLPIIDFQRDAYQCGYSPELAELADRFRVRDQAYGTREKFALGLSLLIEDVNKKFSETFKRD